MTDNPVPTPEIPNLPDAEKKNILIAEDDPFISRMYETKLKAAGFNVTVKNNGRDAFEEIKRNKPNLMILDINMPELSGFELLTALQSDGFDFSTCPVLILTNSAQSQDRETAKKFGADFFIKAELTPRDILQQINTKLGLTPTDSQ